MLSRFMRPIAVARAARNALPLLGVVPRCYGKNIHVSAESSSAGEVAFGKQNICRGIYLVLMYICI